jgi:hypothetical protein
VILVRYVHAGKGPHQQEQRRLAGSSFTVGRSAKCQIQLPDGEVALEHARITVSPAGAVITASGGPILVDGRRTQSAPIGVGDRIQIGPYLLQAEAPAPGLELELVVTRPVVASARIRKAFIGALLALPRMSKRRMSYLAFLATLVLFLGLPALPELGVQERMPVPAAQREVTQQLSAALASGLMQTWNPGPVSAGHQVFYENCRACHALPFVQVRDAECIECHQTIEAHVPRERYTGPTGRAFLQTRCTECHSEHKGQPVVLRAQERCADCHADVERVALDAKSEDVVDFRTTHPQFRLTLPDPDDAKGVVRVRQGNPPPADLVERSNLKFNHALHLDPLGIRDPEGRRDQAGVRDEQGNRRVLECADCHAPGAGGRLMAPVSMERHCRSCHSLAFEPKVSQRQVPHGDAQEVATMLSEFYARLVLGEAPPGATPPADLPRVRPGAVMSYPERQRALELAEQKARRVLDELYDERGVCATCHYVSRDAQSGVWRVEPVRMNHVWMPQALFTHRAHDTQSCTTCHEVRHSKRAEDIAMPDLARCRDCHVGVQPVLGKVTSDCATCHAFHYGKEPWHGAPKVGVQAKGKE